ncbi:MAG: HlyD family efflux transporter periplasmic adaptor subunit [Verrucomicrobiota bacterium]|nr:HlyD family efflux transporter periplasmic adaptor subunit [Verrucomicrobiota bacterium]
MRRVLQISLPLIILGVGVYGAHWLLTNRQKVIPEPTELFMPVVEVVAVTAETYTPQISSQGRVEPGRTIKFNPEISGRISSVASNLVEGLLVRKGQKLYQIDDRDYRTALIKADSDIASSQAAITNAFAQISSSKARMAQAAVMLEKEEAEALAARKEWQLLGKTKNPPDLLVRKPQIKEAEANLASAKAMVEAAIIGSTSGIAALVAANAAKDQAALNVSRCVVNAPFDSRVDSVNVDIGSYVAPSIAALVLQRIDQCEIKLPLAVREFDFLGIGGPSVSDQILRALGDVTLSSGQHNWSGYLSRVNGDIDSLTQTISVVAKVDSPYEKDPVPLRFGLFVKATIRGAPIKEVVQLPETALRSESDVYVYNHGKLHSSKVEIIRREHGFIYVQGLSDGERVCVTQLDSFKEKMPVILAREE